jgi:multiple sugar transport system permease protein
MAATQLTHRRGRRGRRGPRPSRYRCILTFLNAWNQLLWPMMAVQSEDLRPVKVGAQYFFQFDVAWGPMMAYATLITIPVLVLFLSFQRAFIGSIASSGVKG